MRNPFAIEEDPQNPVPREAFGWRIYAVAFGATWASAMYGYDSALIGGTLALPSFKTAFGLNAAASASLSSNIVSTFQGGAFFGVIIGTFFSERFGRRWTIGGSGIIFMIGVILQMIGKIGLLYAGRAFTGLGVGGSSVLLPIYISECAPAPIRGRLVGIFEIMLQIALVFGFWVNYGVNKDIAGTNPFQWHIPVAIQFIPSGLLVLSLPFLIESPRWLVSQGREAEALKALSWVRNLSPEHEYIQWEIKEMRDQVQHELDLTNGKTSVFQTFGELKEASIRNRILICVALHLLQNLTGINAINYYSPAIFKGIGFTGTSTSLLATGVYGLIKMITTVIFMVFFVDRFGRRPALLIGAVGAFSCMLYLGIFSTVTNSFVVAPPKGAGANAAVAMIYLYAIFYGFSWNGIPWIFASEVLPTRVRGLGMMCTVCMQWLAQFMIVYSLPYMVKSIKEGIFFFLAACTVCALLFAYFFVPETKGVVLEDMELLFGPNTPRFAVAKRKAYEEAHLAGITGGQVYFPRDQKTEDTTDVQVEDV